MDAQRKWYVIHTFSGHENRVIDNIEQKIHSLGMEEEVFRAVLPMINETEIGKDGKKKTIKKRLFPGYVFVEMIVTDRSWYMVRNTPGVTGFIGSGVKPIPISETEFANIIKYMGIDDSKPKINIKVQQTVKIKEGAFTDCIGKVIEVDEERGKLKLLVSMFGRETPFELDANQVELVDY